MSARARDHIRSNVYGFIAIFIALSGTAYAVNGPLEGKNQVGSADIINGEVKNQDLGADAVTADKLANDAVGSAEVAGNSLGGGDVNEASFGQVPSAVLGGIGRSVHSDAICSPTTLTFIDCGFTTLNLPSATRVLVNASTFAFNGSDGGCRLVTSTGSVISTIVSANTPDAIAVSAVSGLVGPGSVDFGLECRGNGGSSDPSFTQVNISAVALSAN